MKRGIWSNRYSFYIATVGSAFSLGNIWRFPYVADSNGGGAFVLIYILCAVSIGLPLVIAELIIGKSYRKSVVAITDQASQESLSPFVRKIKPWMLAGFLSNFVSVILLAFYTVICGWVLFFFMQYLIRTITGESISHDLFKILMENGWLQVGLMSVHLLFASVIVSRGLKGGIERLTTLIVPVFVIVIIYLVYNSFSLSGSKEAVRFLFYPNFSSFQSNTLLKILGHVFFTLSLGMGAMVVFGSYLAEERYIPRTGFRVTILDLLVSFLSGFLIFPIIFTSNYTGVVGPSLLFSSLTLLFEQIGLGKVFGLFFFLCLYLAALGASLMLLETSVANLIDRRKMRRSKASWIMVLTAFIFAIPPALSSSILSGVRVFGKDLLILYDSVLIEMVLPLSALGMALFVGFGIHNDLKEKLFIDKTQIESEKLYRNWNFFIRWVVPSVIIGAFLISIISS